MGSGGVKLNIFQGLLVLSHMGSGDVKLNIFQGLLVLSHMGSEDVKLNIFQVLHPHYPCDLKPIDLGIC
jgi:Flp pilus assembly protein protease CpaA